MRKFIVLLLAFTMLFTTIGYASPGEKESSLGDKLQKTIYVDLVDGKYKVSSKDNGLKATMLKEYGVYKLKDGTLLSYTGTDTYQKVELLSLALTDTNAIQEAIIRYGLSEEIKNDILAQSAQAIENNNQNASVSIVVPSQPMILAQSDVYYTYNGKPMKDTTLFYFGLDSGFKYIKLGYSTKDFCSTTYNFALVGAGFSAYPVIAVGSAGLSLLEMWIAFTKEVSITAANEDYTQICWNWDKSDKYTYIDLGSGWQLGCVTQNVYINTIWTKTYFYRGTFNTTSLDTYNPRTTVTSPHFYNPAPFAFQNVSNPINERMSTNIGIHTQTY